MLMWFAIYCGTLSVLHVAILPLGVSSWADLESPESCNLSEGEGMNEGEG